MKALDELNGKNRLQACTAEWGVVFCGSIAGNYDFVLSN
jgi:hypothetical protein